MDHIHNLTQIDKWFLYKLRKIVYTEQELATYNKYDNLSTKTNCIMGRISSNSNLKIERAGLIRDGNDDWAMPVRGFPLHYVKRRTKSSYNYTTGSV